MDTAPVKLGLLEDFSAIEQLVQGEDVDVLLEGVSTLPLHLAVGQIRLLSLRIAQSVATSEQILSMQSSGSAECPPFTLAQTKQFAMLQIKANLFLDHNKKKRLPLLNLVPRLLLSAPSASDKPVAVKERATQSKGGDGGGGGGGGGSGTLLLPKEPHELAALQLTQQLQREEKAAEAKRIKNKQRKKAKDKQTVAVDHTEEEKKPNGTHELPQDKGEEHTKEAEAFPLASILTQADKEASDNTTKSTGGGKTGGESSRSSSSSSCVLATFPLPSPPLVLVENPSSSASSSTSEQAVIIALREELRDVKQKHEEIVRALHLRLYIAQNALEEEIEKNNRQSNKE